MPAASAKIVKSKFWRKPLILLGFCPLFGLLRKPLIDYNKPYFSAPVLNLILREPQSFLDAKNLRPRRVRYVAERLFKFSKMKFRGGRIVLERSTDGNHF